jgi:hypothetical protein
MPRSFRLLSLVVLCALLGLAALPPAPAGAQERRIVERWRGTIRISQTFNTLGTPAELMFTGIALDHYDLRYDIAVDDEGFANGDVFVRLGNVAVRMVHPYLCSAAVAGCKITHQITNPAGSTFWEGRRYTDEQGRPRLLLERTVGDGTMPQVVTRMCGKVAPFYTTEQCFDDGAQDWGFETPTDFVIAPEREGRPPLALPLDAHFQNESMSRNATGRLVGRGEEPTVDLDVELLERSRFFTQVPVDNRLDANLSWNSPDGGRVTWQVERESDTVGPTKVAQVTKHKDVGFAVPGRQTVQVQAQNSIGKSSAPDTTQLTAIRWPVSAESPANVSTQKLGKVVAYRYRLVEPNPPFKGKIDMVPSWIPIFGGAPLGVEDAQASGEVEVLSTGEGYGKLEGKAWFVGMDQALGGAITVKAQAIMDDQFGVEFPSGEFGLKVNGKLKHRESVLELVPVSAGAMLAINKVSPAAYDAINKLFIVAELEPKIELKFKLKDEAGKIAFVSGEARPAIGFKSGLLFELVKDTATATVTFGGEVAQGLQVPAPYLKDTEIKVMGNLKIVMGFFVYEYERSVTCAFRPGGVQVCEQGPKLASLSTAGGMWKHLDRSYIADPNYGQWVAAEPPVVNGGASDQRLVAVVSPQAAPALAIDPAQDGSLGTSYLAWGHDRADLPAGSSRELMLAERDGNNPWDAPLQLTSDDRDDWNPQVAVTPNGYPLLIWQRMGTATPADINVDPAAYFGGMQIAAGRATGQQAIAPTMLSSSGLNYRPQLGATSTGGVATWVSNPANQVGGDAAHPDTIMAARYTEGTNSWGAPAPVVSNLGGLVDYTLATNGAHAAVVYSLDSDGNRATDGDRELFAVRWQNGAWAVPERLTNNAVADDAPQLVLGAAGEPLLVWKQGGALVSRASWAGAPAPMGLADVAERSDYTLVRDADGAAALVWQELEPGDTRLGYAVYDRARGLWSAERSVAPPAPAAGDKSSMATSLAPALIGRSSWTRPQLIVAYLLADVTGATREVAGQQIPNTPQVGAHSLRVLQETVGANLSISRADLSSSSAGAAAGQTVQVHAAVRNTGALAVQGVPVSLLSGPVDDPFGQRDVVATRQLPLVRAGETYTVTFDVARPAEARRWSVEVERADEPCQEPCSPRPLEIDYTDNEARLGAEYGIAPLPTEYTPQGAVAVARVTQAGGLYVTQATTATVRLGASDGPVVAEVPVAFPVEPTDVVTLTAWLPPELVGPGQHALYWELDPGTLLGERDRGDNIAIGTVGVLPDLESGAELLGWGRTAGAPSTVWLRVENTGSAASAATSASVWSGDQLLGRIDIPALAPGAAADVEGSLPANDAGYPQLAVQLDADNAVAEVNENNNLVLGGGLGAAPPPGGGGGYRAYLPLVAR